MEPAAGIGRRAAPSSQLPAPSSQRAGVAREPAADAFWRSLRVRLRGHSRGEDGEDDVQEALIAVLRRFGCEPGVPFVRAVAYGLAALRRRRAGRLRRQRPVELLGDLDVSVAAVAPVISSEVAPRRAAIDVHLRQRDADVLEARLQGLGVKATARRLGTSPSAVRRARARVLVWAAGLLPESEKSTEGDPPSDE